MKKIVTENTAVRGNKKVIYEDKYNILHAVKSTETAFGTGAKKCIITDEIDSDNGLPLINGVRTETYGAGQGYIYLSKEAKKHDYRYLVLEDTYEAAKGVSVHHKDLTKAEKKAYKIAYDFYMMLK